MRNLRRFLRHARALLDQEFGRAEHDPCQRASITFYGTGV